MSMSFSTLLDRFSAGHRNEGCASLPQLSKSSPLPSIPPTPTPYGGSAQLCDCIRILPLQTWNNIFNQSDAMSTRCRLLSCTNRYSALGIENSAQRRVACSPRLLQPLWKFICAESFFGNSIEQCQSCPHVLTLAVVIDNNMS